MWWDNGDIKGEKMKVWDIWKKWEIKLFKIKKTVGL